MLPKTRRLTAIGVTGRSKRGFDEFFGTLPGHGSFWDPAGLMWGNQPIAADGDFYYTEAITDAAVASLQSANSPGRYLRRAAVGALSAK
jgi:hypothetical protein